MHSAAGVRSTIRQEGDHAKGKKTARADARKKLPDRAPKDLDAAKAKAVVGGGKVSFQDLNFTHTVSKSTATL